MPNVELSDDECRYFAGRCGRDPLRADVKGRLLKATGLDIDGYGISAGKLHSNGEAAEEVFIVETESEEPEATDELERPQTGK